MRPIEVTFPENADIELENLLKKEKDIRVYRRAQAILEVVKVYKRLPNCSSLQTPRYANGSVDM